MPKCVVCKAMLPPDFLFLTEDGLARKCIFCERSVDTIEYYSELEKKQLKTTKTDTIKEYDLFLKEISDMPNVTDILDAIKEKKSGIILS